MSIEPRSDVTTASGSARREKTLDVGVEDGRLRFSGRLHDTYREVDGVTTIHEFVATGTISIPELEILAIQLEARTVPYGTCRLTLARVEDLVGLRIVPGFSGEVLRRLGGTAGCSHVTNLVLDLAAAGVLHWFIEIRKHLPYSTDNRESGRWGAVGLSMNPDFVNVCHGWSGTMLARAEEVLRLSGLPKREGGDR